MISIGSKVRARLVKITPYGLYFTYANDAILVLAPEISWNNQREFASQASIGDERDILILLKNEQSGEYVGSLRRLDRASNPYLALEREPNGKFLSGVLESNLGNAWSVLLYNGARGIVHNADETRRWQSGESVIVTIKRMDSQEGILELEIVNAHESMSAQAANGVTVAEARR